MNEDRRMLPMFPLGSNIFPTQVLPLHIFEERYRRLMDDLLGAPDPNDTPTFGVVLIERGRETGGGDVRADVATRVELLGAQQFDDGRWGVVVAGVERVSVVEWLDDDPYPRAIVEPRLRHDTGGGSLDEVEELVRRALAIGSELAGVETIPLEDLSGDPLERLDQLSAVAPLTAFDRQRILAAETTVDQLELLGNAVTEKLQLLDSERDRPEPE